MTKLLIIVNIYNSFMIFYIHMKIKYNFKLIIIWKIKKLKNFSKDYYQIQLEHLRVLSTKI
jgi:hypothetical protein